MEQYHVANKLHSEVLEENFGRIDVQVLCDDDHVREVLLMDELLIARTYALTMKNNEWWQNKEICAVNDAIKNGEAIGRAFKKRGFNIRKNVLSVYITTMPPWLQVAFETNSTKSKARITEFIIEKDDAIYNYGIIAEIYSPAFRKPFVSVEDELQINIPSRALLKLGFSKEEIWASLTHKTLSPDVAKQYSSIVAEVKEKVHEIMMESLPLLTF